MKTLLATLILTMIICCKPKIAKDQAETEGQNKYVTRSLYIKRVSENLEILKTYYLKSDQKDRCGKSEQVLQKGSKVFILSPSLNKAGDATVFYKAGLYCIKTSGIKDAPHVISYYGGVDGADDSHSFLLSEDGTYYFSQPWEYVKGLRDYSISDAIGTYRITDNLLTVCNLVNLTSKKSSSGSSCYTELYRPEPGVWRHHFTGHLQYKITEHSNGKIRKIKNGIEVYKTFDLEVYKRKVFADIRLFPMGSGGSDTLSKCRYSFCIEQDRWPLKGPFKGRIIGIQHEDWNKYKTLHMLKFHLFHKGKVYGIDSSHISNLTSIKLLVGFLPYESDEKINYFPPRLSTEKIMLLDDKRYVLYTNFYLSKFYGYGGSAVTPFSYGSYEFKEGKMFLCPQKIWFKPNSKAGLKCYTKLVRTKNHWVNSLNAKIVFHKYTIHKRSIPVENWITKDEF